MLGSAAPEERVELLYKILVVGDIGVGKTSLIKRYVHNLWSSDYRATIGVDFALKEIFDVGSNTTIRVQLWDIAGQERFKNLTRVYYKEAVGAVIVYDISNDSTLESAKQWKTDMDHKVLLPDGSTIPCVLVANKADLPNKRSRTGAQMHHICAENQLAAWFETSAKTGEGVDHAFNWLIRHIYTTNLRAGGRQQDTDALALTERGLLSSSMDGSAHRRRGCAC
eukprot:TRINITY_DN23355_c0_g1_i1.p1 TRINITY_DN23355_c0_g1~~TRINITY_DN23355_c0_g1_i1.p1  ORF type:complete len:259 (+),score=89.67 TRINITY_DN23355_c0_g1_i1:106-777(+)